MLLLIVRHLQEVGGDTDQPSKGTGSNTDTAGRTRLEDRGVGGSRGRGVVADRDRSGRLGGVGISRRSHGGESSSASGRAIQIVSYLIIDIN